MLNLRVSLELRWIWSSGLESSLPPDIWKSYVVFWLQMDWLAANGLATNLMAFQFFVHSHSTLASKFRSIDLAQRLSKPLAPKSRSSSCTHPQAPVDRFNFNMRDRKVKKKWRSFEQTGAFHEKPQNKSNAHFEGYSVACHKGLTRHAHVAHVTTRLKTSSQFDSSNLTPTPP